MESPSKRPNESLLEALCAAQESLSQCEVYYGESNDDSCRAMYARIKEMLHEQQQMVEQDIQYRQAGDEYVPGE
jgi:hypothetical protein